MGSEIQSDRATNAQDLRDLQESYRKRRERIQEQGERDLKEAREDNARQLRQERLSGDAAVNHVRQDAAERLEQIKRDADQRTAYENARLAQSRHAAKTSGESSLQSLQQSIEDKKSHLRHEDAEVRRREQELSHEENARTHAVEAEQARRREAVGKAAQHDIEEFQTKAQKQKAKIHADLTRDISHESEAHREKIHKMREEHQKIYQSHAKYSEAQLKSQAERDEKRLETERQEFLKRQTRVKTASRQALAEEKENAEKRLSDIDGKNRDQIAGERHKGETGMQETREHYSKEIARLHKDGDAGVAEQRQLNEEKTRLLRAQQKSEREHLMASHDEDMKDLDAVYKQRAQQNEIVYKQGLLQQRHEFEQARAKNQAAFADTVRLQRETLAKSLAREKREVMEDVGKFNGRRDDPFYHLTQVDGRLSENDKQYVVTANVPEHEKDNVKVVVKDDKVVVKGHRRFQDHLDENGKKIATESYQTFHEEIPLSHPVREKYARSSWNDGVLTVVIPKA